MSKRLMILGAGPFQVSAIQKAVSLGHHVITVDYLPDNVGHRCSHEYVKCSTVNRSGVLAAASKAGVDGICTFSSDVAIPTVGHVCDRMGFIGVSERVADTMANKHRFRSFQSDNGLPHPRFVFDDGCAGICNALSRLNFPVMFKPVDTSGSRGVRKQVCWDPKTSERLFLEAQEESRSGVVCVEEFVPGREVGGDGFLKGGRLAPAVITHKHMNGFVVAGHSIPTNISLAEQQEVVASLESCCACLGYTDGPLNFDVILGPDGPMIVEMSARNGGNGIPQVIQRALGVDIEQATLRWALGEDVSLPVNPPVQQPCGSLVFGSDRRGRFKRICQLDALHGDVPEVFHMFVAKRENERVEPFDHNGNMIGYVLFDQLDSADYERLCIKIRERLCIELAEEAST